MHTFCKPILISPKNYCLNLPENTNLKKNTDIEDVNKK